MRNTTNRKGLSFLFVIFFCFFLAVNTFAVELTDNQEPSSSESTPKEQPATPTEQSGSSTPVDTQPTAPSAPMEPASDPEPTSPAVKPTETPATTETETEPTAPTETPVSEPTSPTGTETKPETPAKDPVETPVETPAETPPDPATEVPPSLPAAQTEAAPPPVIQEDALAEPIPPAVEPTFKATIPLSLPVNVSSSGTALTATNVKITNLSSSGKIQLFSATIKANNGWELKNYDSDISAIRMDSKVFGFRLNGQVAESSGIINVSGFSPFDINQSFLITYDFKISPQSFLISNESIANVVIVVDWYQDPVPQGKVSLG